MIRRTGKMFRDLCRAGLRYERLLKLAALEEASIAIDKYIEVIDIINGAMKDQGYVFKVPGSLEYIECERLPQGGLRYRSAALRLCSKLIEANEETKRKRPAALRFCGKLIEAIKKPARIERLKSDLRALAESISESDPSSLFSGSLEPDFDFPLCDYLQTKYLAEEKV